MKKIFTYALSLTLVAFTSCNVFDVDNYDEPKETIKGEILDKATGKRILTDQGSEGIRVRLTELSWGENVEHNPDFYCMADGTYQNTKLFKGQYHIDVVGPFIPLIREDERGVPIANESVETEIKGTTVVNFAVEPFLNIEWVSEPTVTNGKVKAQVRVTRGVSEEIFKQKIEPMGKYKNEFLNVTDVQFFVSYSSSVGYRTRDTRWSSEILYAGNEFNPKFGEVITLESNGEIPAGRTVFIRAAARINYDTPVGSGVRRWNYNEGKEVRIPQ